MTAVTSHFNIFIIFICTCFAKASIDRRFSDFKRCADEECSMLLCRGKASKDFTAPDCRFLSFKKGETIYVYYKLSGQRSDVWAGSVGNSFGYFPKDFLNINHIYTEKEIEVRSEETDFVCFDTGLDRFESYDLDELLRSWLKDFDEPSDRKEDASLSEEVDKDKEMDDTSSVNSHPSNTESEVEDDTATEDEEDMQHSESIQLPSETTASNAKEGSNVVRDPGENIKTSDDDDDLEKVINKDEASRKDSGVVEISEHTTPVEAVSEVKTTLGTTFDAVTTDDVNTQRISPYDDEDQSNDTVELPSEIEEEIVKTPSLLTFEQNVSRYFDDTVPGSEDRHVPAFQEGVVSLREEDAEDGEVEEPGKSTDNKDGMNSDQLLRETEAEHKVEDEDSETVRLPSETAASYANDKESYTVKKSPDDSEVDTDTEDEEDVQHSETVQSETAASYEKEGSNVVSDPVENIKQSEDDAHLEKVINKDQSDEASRKDSGVLEKSEHTTPVEAVSQVKSTLGTTFDAVTTDDVNTQRVTPDDDEDQSNDVDEQPRETEAEIVKTPALLTYEENRSGYPEDTRPGSDHQSVSVQPSVSDEVEKDDDGTLSNLGDTDFKIVSGDEETDLHEEDGGEDTVEEDEEADHTQVKTTEKDSDEIDGSETSEVKDEAKPVNDSVTNSLNNTKYAEVQEQNTNVLKYEEELEKVTGTSLDQDETRNDAVESESDPPSPPLEDVKLVLDTPIKSVEEKHIEMASVTVSREGAQSAPELGEQTDTDEQTDRAKAEIINLLEETLKREQSENDIDEEAEEEEEEVEDVGELLEDENAVLSTKRELPDKAVDLQESTMSENTNLESQLEKDELSTRKTPHDDLPDSSNKNTSDQIKHDGKTSTETPLDVSVSPPDKGNTTNDADELKNSAVSKEPEYSDSVMRLTLLRDHFNDGEMERMLRHLSIKDLYRIEAMFADLDKQLKSARQLNPQNSEEFEYTLDTILEGSENAILDEIDKMLDARQQRALDLRQQIDPALMDEEVAVLDSFQEFIFSLHQKYSSSIPSVKENQSRFETAENASEAVEKPVESIPLTEAPESPEVQQEVMLNLNGQDGESQSQDVSPGEDGGHFNKNEDIQAEFQETKEIQRGPQAILDNPLDIVGFDIDPPSDSLDSLRASDFSDNKANYEQASTPSADHVWEFFLPASELLGVYAEILIAALPEEWQPGPTFHGLPWKPVVATAVVGVLTVLVFMWRSVLAVKAKMYLLTEKQLAERIQQLVSEKSDVLRKITELNNSIEQYEEKLNNSEESRTSLQKEFNELKTHYQDLNKQKEKLCVHFTQLREKVANAQEENKTLNVKISTMQEGIKKYQKTLNVYDEERSKVQVLMDEAKLREDALRAQMLSFERDNCALKEQKKSLLQDTKDWQEKHETLSEQIKVYHKTQSELENSLVHKENEIEVLSGCIAELKSLESCNDTENVSGNNGDPLKVHLKQMMDVSRIKATLSVMEDERNRWLENFMAEQKARQELEEQFQKVTHEQTNLKNERTLLENQYKNLQQRLEITTELYHQKENMLHQKLTQEELERHEKETKLSEVDSRALQAEEELNCLKQKVKDVQEEMQQNERSLKAEIAVQEKKAHENWLKARASERALVEERRECANLRQKIVECSDKMSDLEHALYKSAPPDRHVPPVQRGDSYGPSPVSGGAPSPPLMIEDPGRPPSGSMGRRSETFGPRLDSHNRSTDLGHPLPFRPEMSVPRTSSPCTQEGSISKSQRPGSFLPSPIRESPVPAPNALPKAYGPPPMGGARPPLNGPLPPLMRPPNGHSAMMPPLFRPDTFRPPHMDSYRPPFPLRPYGSIPPPFVPGPPLRDFPSMGPHPPPPPPHGIHDFPPNFAGPKDLPFPPRPFPPPGAMVPPTLGAHGPAPPTPLHPRDSQEMPHSTDVPPKQRVAQETPTPAVTEP